MTTPLPEPAVHGLHAYTESQMKAYGTAEYARAIADASKECDHYDGTQIGIRGYFKVLAEKIRKLGETP